MRVRGGRLLLLLLSLAGSAQAQEDVCRPGRSSNEARTMATFGVPLAFSDGMAPRASDPWTAHVGLELVYLPKVADAVATPTICRPDKPGPENTDLLFAAPRPRAWLSLPAGFSIEASWIPPVKLSEVRANLWGVALSRTTPLRGQRFFLAIRAHATLGKIEAPITCDDAALSDANSPCYQGTRSNDAFRPNVLGVSASLSWVVRGRFRPYVGAGYNHLAPRFQVNFTNRFGSLDRRKVIVDLDRAVLFGGASWTPHSVVDLGAEIYAAPVDAVTGRLVARVRLPH